MLKVVMNLDVYRSCVLAASLVRLELARYR